MAARASRSSARPLAEDTLLSPVDVSQITGMSTKALAQFRWRGLGPAYVKVGRLVRYRTSAVEEWLDANTVEPRNAVAS